MAGVHSVGLEGWHGGWGGLANFFNPKNLLSLG